MDTRHSHDLKSKVREFLTGNVFLLAPNSLVTATLKYFIYLLLDELSISKHYDLIVLFLVINLKYSLPHACGSAILYQSCFPLMPYYAHHFITILKMKIGRERR